MASWIRRSSATPAASLVIPIPPPSQRPRHNEHQATAVSAGFEVTAAAAAGVLPTSGGGASGEADAPARRSWLARLHSPAMRPRDFQRSTSFFQAPETLIFALGLAALLSAIVFACNMMRNVHFNPMTVIVFATTGTYCIVLIRRQRALAAAERAIILEFTTNTNASSETPPRILGKGERRALLTYFVFTPEEGQNKPAERRENIVSGGTQNGTGRGSGSWVPGSPPPPYNSQLFSATAVTDEEAGRPTHEASAPPTNTEEAEEGSAELATGRSRPATFLLAGEVEGASGEAQDPTPQIIAPTTAAPPTSTSLAKVETVDASESMESNAPVELPYRDVGGDLELASLEIGPQEILPSFRDPDLEDLECGGKGAGTGTGNMADEGEETKVENDYTAGGEKSPQTRPVSRTGSSQWSTADSCIVCFGEYAVGDQLCRLPCRHVYHAECIDQWFDGPNHAWCPLCKQEIVSSTHAAGGGRGNDPRPVAW